MKPHQAGLLGDVGEGPIAIVSQQGAREPAAFAKPSPAHHPDIEQAVVVIITLLNIEGPYLADQAGFARTFDEGAVAVIMEITQLAIGVPGGDHDVVKAVVVKVVDDDAAGEVAGIQTQPGADI